MPREERSAYRPYETEKPTVVNFWATWCPYCLREMEAFQSMYERYGDRVNFVMLNVADTSG